MSAYYGLVPRHGDSGERVGNNGHITKAGDSLVRLLLTEAVSGSLVTARSNSKAIRKGAVVAEDIEREARKCNARNRSRAAHLRGAGKNANVVKVALAGELARDMWIIGKMVQRAGGCR